MAHVSALRASGLSDLSPPRVAFSLLRLSIANQIYLRFIVCLVKGK